MGDANSEALETAKAEIYAQINGVRLRAPAKIAVLLEFIQEKPVRSPPFRQLDQAAM